MSRARHAPNLVYYVNTCYSIHTHLGKVRKVIKGQQGQSFRRVSDLKFPSQQQI